MPQAFDLLRRQGAADQALDRVPMVFRDGPAGGADDAVGVVGAAGQANCLVPGFDGSDLR